MSSADLRRRLAAISKEQAVAAQGFRTNPPLRFADYPTAHGGYLVGGRKPRAPAKPRKTKAQRDMEMIHAHHVHGYHVPEEYVHEHASHSKRGKKELVHGFERHAHGVHGYEMPAHMQHKPTHHAKGGMSPQVAELVDRLRNVSLAYGPHGAGAMIGGRKRAPRPASEYQMFVKKHMGMARHHAMASGAMGGAIGQHAMRILGEQWRMQGHGGYDRDSDSDYA
jgi:hypothetical protein